MYIGSPFMKEGDQISVKGSFYKSSSASEIRTMVEQMCAFKD